MRNDSSSLDEKQVLRLGLGGGVEEFVALDFGGDADASVIARFDTHHLALATNVDVAGLSDLFGQGDYEIDGVADGELGFRKKIKATVTDIASMGFEFEPAGFVRKHPQRQCHRESPRFAALRSVGHETSLGALDLRNANTRLGRVQSEKASILS